jgi:predicted GH43/DUF377 family glycosyl hydrolase
MKSLIKEEIINVFIHKKLTLAYTTLESERISEILCVANKFDTARDQTLGVVQADNMGGWYWKQIIHKKLMLINRDAKVRLLVQFIKESVILFQAYYLHK